MSVRARTKRLLAPIYRGLLSPRWAEMLGQVRTGAVSESDIELFGMLDGVEGLVVDAGANRGQFALSLFAVNRSLKVLAFEPNPALRWTLMAIRAIHFRRFRYRLHGLGDREQRLVLHVPRTRGIDLSSNASLDPAEFERDLVRERLADYSSRSDGRYRFTQRKARLIPLDSLGLSPVVVKIDVEGWELAVLTGMRDTIERCHPLLMIELNRPERFMPFLEELGYRFYAYDAESGTLSSDRLIEGRLNIFAVHPESPKAVVERLPGVARPTP